MSRDQNIFSRIFANRCSQRALDGPTHAQAPTQRVVRDAVLYCPIHLCLSTVLKSYIHIASFITGLCGDGSPNTVIRKVTEVIIFTLNRHPFRTVAHVGIKILKRLQPTTTHFNSTLKIMNSCVAGRLVGAPLFHAQPYIINRRVTHPMSLVFRITSHAPAALNTPIAQQSTFSNCLVSARAKTQPYTKSVFTLSQISLYDQTSIGIASLINKTRAICWDWYKSLNHNVVIVARVEAVV